jgi:DNA-binding response OmpR family regulator
MQKQVLVIEDERDIADLIRLHLEDLNYVVSVARDGNTGLRKGSTGSWDLIILDLRLPGVDGLEICMQASAPEIRVRPDSHANFEILGTRSRGRAGSGRRRLRH